MLLSCDHITKVFRFRQSTNIDEFSLHVLYFIDKNKALDLIQSLVFVLISNAITSVQPLIRSMPRT